MAFGAGVTLFLTLFISVPISSQGESSPGHLRMVQDWSVRHALFARFGPAQIILAAERDPRAGWSWLKNTGRGRGSGPALGGLRSDWSINLGVGGTAAGMSPAKFTFDVLAPVSGPANQNNCLNDFVVYPVDAAGSATQPNLVAFNNLYSGTAGGAGICNRTAVPGVDTGTAATVMWSYNVSAIGGAVATSPAIYFDPTSGASDTGQAVAFVESAAGSPAHFHVLAWRSGDGRAANLQNALAPAQITSFVATAPLAGSGTATDLPLGSLTTGTDTNSSPYVDYEYDRAYVGNDAGELFRIKDAFCTHVNPAYPSCNAPSLDSTWGTGGMVTVGPGSCAGTTSSMLTGPVVDSVTGNVYVGCADGKLYGFDSTGAPLSPGFVTVGEGTLASGVGGIADAPVVDGVNAFVYATSGSNGANAVLVQASTTNLGVAATATLGAARVRNVHTPALNDAYFSSATSTNWAILSCGFNAGGTATRLFAVGFNGARNMNAGAPPAGNSRQIRAAADECSPPTEFLNTGSGTDWLFLSVLGTANVRSFNITGVTGAGGIPAATHTTAEAGGASGIIVDNISAAAQASSVYFSRLGSSACAAGGTGHCAVKLTQGALN